MGLASQNEPLERVSRWLGGVFWVLECRCEYEVAERSRRAVDGLECRTAAVKRVEAAGLVAAAAALLLLK